MQSRKTDDTYIVKVEQGELVLETLTTFCEQAEINNAYLTGIGSVQDLTCGYYELKEKQYHFTDYPEPVEVASMIGNVALKEGRPSLHVHAVFTDKENRAFGGHVKEMTAAVVLEVFIKTYDTEIERELDEEIGLFLMNCG